MGVCASEFRCACGGQRCWLPWRCYGHLMWVLGLDRGSSARDTDAPNPWATSPAQEFLIQVAPSFWWHIGSSRERRGWFIQLKVSVHNPWPHWQALACYNVWVGGGRGREWGRRTSCRNQFFLLLHWSQEQTYVVRLNGKELYPELPTGSTLALCGSGFIPRVSWTLGKHWIK